MQENDIAAHGAGPEAPRELMTTAEVAAYLRLRERKVYDLLRTRRIPASRVAGKWLFPKQLIDLWVAQHVEYDGAALAHPPAIAAGSHDPLLEWALRESRCGLALLPGGSVDGLRRVAAGEAAVAGLHLLAPETGDYNIAAVRQLAPRLDLVLIAWAWREQGLVLPPGNPLGLEGLADVAARRCRLMQRQEEAGSQFLLRHLLAQAGIDLDSLNRVEQPALSHTDLATAILDGKADCGLAVRSVAQQFRLDFLPLHRERFDLLLRRRDYFEPAVQKLLAFARTPAFAERTRDLRGYDIEATGRVVYNA